MNATVERVFPLADFLGIMFGASTEVAVHDFTDLDHSLVRVVNPQVSGRRVGAPATDLVLKILKEGSQDNRDYVASYASRSIDGRTLHSGSYFIREDGKIVGMLCVNRDISAFRNLEDALNNLIEAYTPGGSLDAKERGLQAARASLDSSGIESMIGSPTDMVSGAIARARAALRIEGDALDATQRSDIVAFLDAEGVFQLKGAVSDIAAELGISEPTVYRYLQKARRRKH